MRNMVNMSKRNRLVNGTIAVAVGAVCVGALWVFGVPGIDPSLWNELSVVSGIRPPREIFPGLWRISVGWLFSLFGVDGAVSILTVVGHLAAGVCVALVYLIIRRILELVCRTGSRYFVWECRIVPFFAGMAALTFGISDPFWRICRVFSSDALQILMFLVAIVWTLKWLSDGGNRHLFPLMALMGLLAAETPFGVILPIFLIVAYVLVWHGIIDDYYFQPDALPGPKQLPKWRMFFIFLGALAVGVWINAASFIRLGGLQANGWNGADIYFRYLAGYGFILLKASSPLYWVLGFGCCVLPFVVALRISPWVLRDDRAMPFRLGVILFFASVVAIMQSGAFPSARFWTFSKDSIYATGDFPLVIYLFCVSIALALAGAAFTFECQRKYISAKSVSVPRALMLVVPTITVLVVLMALRNVPHSAEAKMQRLVDDAIAETVRECGDAKWLFTDGQLDAGIEIESRRRGGKLFALNMMSGADIWDTNLRQRGFDPDSEDRRIVKTGVPALLRVWAGEKPDGLKDAALQLGFEFWKRARKPLPRASGLIAREEGLSEEAAAEGIERANVLSKRVVEISESPANNPSPALACAFSTVNWRLSRFARLRDDTETANALDNSNGMLKKLLTTIERERMRTFMQLTPREGLQLALRRADFSEARRYSAAVLRNNEDDPEANFGMGMSSLQRNDMQGAEQYLKRCLKTRPNEPAVLNNLSIICRKQKRYKEAEDYARQALKAYPDAPEIKRTLADALKKAP